MPCLRTEIAENCFSVLPLLYVFRSIFPIKSSITSTGNLSTGKSPKTRVSKYWRMHSCNPWWWFDRTPSKTDWGQKKISKACLIFEIFASGHHPPPETGMTSADIISLVQTLGAPIITALACLWFIKYITDQMQRNVKSFLIVVRPMIEKLLSWLKIVIRPWAK